MDNIKVPGIKEEMYAEQYFNPVKQENSNEAHITLNSFIESELQRNEDEETIPDMNFDNVFSSQNQVVNGDANNSFDPIIKTELEEMKCGQSYISIPNGTSPSRIPESLKRMKTNTHENIFVKEENIFAAPLNYFDEQNYNAAFDVREENHVKNNYVYLDLDKKTLVSDNVDVMLHGNFSMDQNSAKENYRNQQNECSKPSNSIESEDIAYDEISEHEKHITDALVKHVEAHSSERIFKCYLCPMSFNLNSELMRHIDSHAIKEIFKCYICFKVFTNNWNLRRHLLKHTDEKSYKCTSCPEAFAQKSDLSRHAQSHVVKEVYECTTCIKVFTNKWNLRRHLLANICDKKYTCEVCSKSFKQNHHLKQHLISHTGERKYKCSFCSKSFMWAFQLKRHLKIHSDENVS